MTKTTHPHIVQIVPSFKALGGVERGTIDVALQLTHHNITNSVITAGGMYDKALHDHHIPVHTMPLMTKNPIRLWRHSYEMERYCASNNVSLIHARSRAPAWSAYLAAKRLGLSFLTTYHAPYNAQNAAKRYYNSVMARGDLVIAISQFVRDHIISEYSHHPWFNPDRIRVIPRGIDTGLLTKTDDTVMRGRALLAGWGVAPRGPVIALPGRLTRWKGAEHFIDALGMLRDQGVDFTGLLVGSDQGRTDYSAALVTKIKDLGLASHVHKVGDCRDMTALYSVCDVVTVASLDPEGFGRVTAEAGAMACVAVASHHGASLEIIQDGDTGYFYTPGCAHDLARVLFCAINTDKDMGIRARKRVMEHFSLPQMLSKTMAVYDELHGMQFK